MLYCYRIYVIKPLQNGTRVCMRVCWLQCSPLENAAPGPFQPKLINKLTMKDRHTRRPSRCAGGFIWTLYHELNIVLRSFRVLFISDANLLYPISTKPNRQKKPSQSIRIVSKLMVFFSIYIKRSIQRKCWFKLHFECIRFVEIFKTFYSTSNGNMNIG